MLRSIFTPNRETQVSNEHTLGKEAPLSEAERACLRLVVTRLGVGIADDTSPFSDAERNRLLFVRWLDVHGKLFS